MPAKKKDATDKTNAPIGLADFESAMQELEATVAAMESGELKLEESLARFERGVALVKQCQAALKDAELRVKVLTEDGEEQDLPPLDHDANGAGA